MFPAEVEELLHAFELVDDVEGLAVFKGFVFQRNVSSRAP